MLWGLRLRLNSQGLRVQARFDEGKQRYTVRLDDGKELSLRPECVLQTPEVELGEKGAE